MADDKTVLIKAYNKVVDNLRFINEIIENNRNEKPNPRFIENALHDFCKLVNAEKGLLLMLNTESDDSIFHDYNPEFSKSYNMKLGIPSCGLPIEKKIWFGPEEILRISSPENKKRQKEMDEFIYCIDQDIKSYTWLPIILHQEVVGVVILFNSNGEKGFSSFEVETCTGIDLIGVFTGYQISKDNEYQALINLVGLAVEPLEGRSPYLAGHVNRVVKISKRMAEKLDLTEDERKDLEIATTIHDIGKSKLKDNILFKPIHAGAMLTIEEQVEFQSHAEEGGKLLASISGVNKRIKEAVRYHHERFDGSGFPNRLKGSEIPIIAQIIGTVCVFDQALCKYRYHYPNAYLEKAMADLEAHRENRKLNPELVDILIIILKEMKTIVLLYNKVDELLNDAFILAENGRKEEAHNKCDAAIEEDRNNPAVYIAAGELMEHKNLRDYEIAINYYTRVLEVRPTFIEAYYRRGRAYERSCQLSKAGIDYALAITLCPTYIEAHLRLGQIRLQLIDTNANMDKNKYAQCYFTALNSFKEVIKLEKENILAYLGIGEVLFKLGELYDPECRNEEIMLNETENNRNPSIKYYSKALENCKHALHLIQSDSNQLKRATELNDSKTPEYKVYLYLGLIHDALNEKQTAITYLGRAYKSSDFVVKELAENKLEFMGM